MSIIVIDYQALMAEAEKEKKVPKPFPRKKGSW